MNLTVMETQNFSMEMEILEQRMQDEYIGMYGEPDQDPDNSWRGAEGFVVARETSGALLGMTAWSRWPNGDAKIRLFYVRPENRKQGIASALLAVTESAVRRRGMTHIRFETGPKQDPAVGLYKKFGYKEMEEGFGFYKDSPGSIFLGKDL